MSARTAWSPPGPAAPSEAAAADHGARADAAAYDSYRVLASTLGLDGPSADARSGRRERTDEELFLANMIDLIHEWALPGNPGRDREAPPWSHETLSEETRDDID